MDRNGLLPILMADDDEEDCKIAKKALQKARVLNELIFVEDGEELLDYLRHRGKYQAPAYAPRPGLILLDLNMPRKNGNEVLEEIKSDPLLKQIPVIVLTTSDSEKDLHRVYELGANSYIKKPVTFDGMVKVMTILNEYWFAIVKLPHVNQDN